MPSATPRTQRVIAGADKTPTGEADRPVGPGVASSLGAMDPARGARRREGFLLSAYAVLFVIAVWTVVVAELMPESTDTPRRGGEARGSAAEPTKVTEPTRNP